MYPSRITKALRVISIWRFTSIYEHIYHKGIPHSKYPAFFFLAIEMKEGR